MQFARASNTNHQISLGGNSERSRGSTLDHRRARDARVHPRRSTRLDSVKRCETFRFVSSSPHRAFSVVAHARGRRRRYPAISRDRSESTSRPTDPSIVRPMFNSFSTRASVVIRHPSSRTFLTFSKEATALVWTVFFATVVLETTRTPVKEVVKADMMLISVVVVLVVRTHSTPSREAKRDEAKRKTRFGIHGLVLCDICMIRILFPCDESRTFNLGRTQAPERAPVRA